MGKTDWVEMEHGLGRESERGIDLERVVSVVCMKERDDKPGGEEGGRSPR